MRAGHALLPQLGRQPVDTGSGRMIAEIAQGVDRMIEGASCWAIGPSNT